MTEIYRDAWDYNNEVFKKAKMCLKCLEAYGFNEMSVILSKKDLTEIVNTFAHCRTLESQKPEFAEYWDEKAPKATCADKEQKMLRDINRMDEQIDSLTQSVIRLTAKVAELEKASERKE